MEAPKSTTGTFWKAPVVDGGFGSRPRNGWPPFTRTSLQTYFFMPSLAGTHGPPLSLQPGEPAMAISSFSDSASCAVKWNASFQSGVMYVRRFGTTWGVVRPASKFWKPPIPTRLIHSRSALIPSFVMLPFIQCHQTRGFAESGGFRNPCSSASPEDGAGVSPTDHAPHATSPATRPARESQGSTRRSFEFLLIAGSPWLVTDASDLQPISCRRGTRR